MSASVTGGMSLNTGFLLYENFSPITLFANDEQGYWLDPGDFSTMFQDPAGTIPVTSVGQSVRLMLDKSGRGNNFTQANVANAPILGREPIVGRRNLLLQTDNFGDVYWQKTNVIITPNLEIAPFGTASVLEVVNMGSTGTIARFDIGVSSSNRQFSVFIKKTVTATYPAVAWTAINGAGTALILNTQTGAVNFGSGFPRSGIFFSGSVIHNVADLGDYWRVSISVSTTARTVYVFPYWNDNGASTPNQTGSGSIIFGGAQLEVGDTATNYQRVGTAFDVTESGVPTVHYLSFDGTDDWLQSAATINPGMVDKVQVFAGVRKLVDTGSGTVIEASVAGDANDGAFFVRAPQSGPNYQFSTRGTITRAPAGSGFPAPITNVITGLGDISAPRAIIRVDGAQAAINTSSQGTGNYLTYQHYIGRRGGTTLPFNGRIYQLITRYGPNLPLITIQQTEMFTNQRTGAY
jgi:hypothetical protein